MRASLSLLEWPAPGHSVYEYIVFAGYCCMHVYIVFAGYCCMHAYYYLLLVIRYVHTYAISKFYYCWLVLCVCIRTPSVSFTIAGYCCVCTNVHHH